MLSARPPRLSACQPRLRPLVVDFSYEALAAALGLLVGGRYVRTLDCMRRNGGARESLVREGPTWEALRHLRFDFVGEAVRDAAMRLSEDFALVAKAQAAARNSRRILRAILGAIL